MPQKYLLIESRDPFDSKEVDNDYELASDLAAAGNETTVFLVQNAVLAVRNGASNKGLHELIESGAQVVCDEFSLRERGIYGDDVTKGVVIGPLEIVVEHLANQSKTIWL